MSRLLSALLVSLVAVPVAADDGWQAGFAQVAITPDKPMWMSGYASRTAPADGKETELWAKAAVLRYGEDRQIVLVTLDLVGIDRDTSSAICALIQKKYSMFREAIALACSHTHCGPVVGNNLRSMYFLDEQHSKRVEDYTAQLPARVLKAVEDAVSRLAPVKLTWATGKAAFAVNRRENKEADVPMLRESGTLKGPIDHDVPVLAARDKDGKLKGVIFGYACHATVLSYQKWCGDYPGFAMIEVEKANPGAVAMFFAGCGADQNPLPRRSVELARHYGKQLAAAVQEVLDKPMNALSPQWVGVYKEIDLPLSAIPSREALVKDTEDKNKYVVARAQMLLKKLEKEGAIPATYLYPVQTWRFGKELMLVTLGGEVVVDYSLRLKKELEAGKTWVMGYANDVMAYIPSLRVLKEGGYEGATSMIYYGLPSVWGPRVEELIVAEVHRQVTQVRR